MSTSTKKGMSTRNSTPVKAAPAKKGSSAERGRSTRTGTLPEKGASAEKSTSKKAPAAPATIDEYILGFPPDVQTILSEVREVIRKQAPDAVEAMKYGIPTFVLGENLVHFGGYKSHIGFYPTASGIEAFKEELASYKGARGSVQFPLGSPMPWSLVEKIVAYRVKAVQSKAAAGKKR